jgi:phage shock protein A
MAGAIRSIQEVLTVVQRLSDLEKRHDREFKEMKDGLGAVRSEARDLDRRLLILETRFDGLAHETATEARAAAQSAASLVVAGDLRAIGERIARLEGVVGAHPPSQALPPPGSV